MARSPASEYLPQMLGMLVQSGVPWLYSCRYRVCVTGMMLLTLEMFWVLLSPEWAEQVHRRSTLLSSTLELPFLSELAVSTEIVSDYVSEVLLY